MTSDLTSATLIILVSMCILPLMSSEAMAASKRPRRSHLTSKFNSVTSITYDTMSFLASKGLYDINADAGAKRDPLTCVASPQVKIDNGSF